MDEKTYLRKIRKVVKYWFAHTCPKCGNETIEPDDPIGNITNHTYSSKCIKCGFEIAWNRGYSYINEIDKLAKEGLKLFLKKKKKGV